MRKDFAIVGISVAIVGALVIMIALFTYSPNCPLTRSGLFGGCLSDTVYYLKLLLGIILIVIGTILALVSMRMKLNPSTESIHEETKASRMRRIHRISE